MARTDAVFFDLYETLISEFDPNWRPQPTPADRLGMSAEAFDAEWRARHDAGMIGTYLDY